jgi:hypothetical protein
MITNRKADRELLLVLTESLSVSPRRFANQFCIVQRVEGMWSLGWEDDAPGPFETRRFAESVAAQCGAAS